MNWKQYVLWDSFVKNRVKQIQMLQVQPVTTTTPV